MSRIILILSISIILIGMVFYRIFWYDKPTTINKALPQITQQETTQEVQGIKKELPQIPESKNTY